MYGLFFFLDQLIPKQTRTLKAGGVVESFKLMHRTISRPTFGVLASYKQGWLALLLALLLLLCPHKQRVTRLIYVNEYVGGCGRAKKKAPRSHTAVSFSATFDACIGG